MTAMTKPNHCKNTLFTVNNQCLHVGGIALPLLFERAGKRPFYAYDRTLITQRVQQLRKQLPHTLKLHYAIKANPMPAVVQHLSTLVDGFDVASADEMRVTLDTPMPGHEISFAGPGKRPQELASAIAAGVILHVESEHELETIANLASMLGTRPKIAIRVNPDFELKASGMKMGGGAKQFGIDAERVPGALSQLKTLDLEFVGFHIFSGSQNLKPEAIIEAQTKSCDLGLRLANDAPAPLKKLNIGGGFGIPYFPGEQPLELSEVAANLEIQLDKVSMQQNQAEVIIELGRYLVGEAGIYVCQVVDRKESRGQVFLITDGGLNHHLAASGNFGQIIRKNYPVAIGNKMGIDTLETVSIVGPLCTPLDILADKMELPAAQVGDLVVVFQSGAYGLTASPTAFLSHPSAIEMMV